MPQIGPLEILVVAVLALIVFGPERLPEMARSLAKGVTQLKRMASEVKSEFDLSLEEKEESPTVAKAAAETETEVPSVGTPGAGTLTPTAPVEVVDTAAVSRV